MPFRGRSAPRRSGAADLLIGARNGVIATAAMSVLLAAASLTGTLRRPPPKQITGRVLPSTSEGSINAATVLGHTAYGAGAGVAHRLLARSFPSGPGFGVLYGIALWLVGYEVWVPAAGFLPPAHRDRPRRTLTMLAAHIVYGLVLGALPRPRAR